MHVIYQHDIGFTLSYWDHIQEVGTLEPNASYWMVPNTVEA